jgi:crotonobetainyl-CoA:carnitine CoA-transferase CaiB-like acyl-CoA transferase
VLDLTDALGAYTGRLLALLGADVVRGESLPGADRRAPYLPGRGDISLWDLYVNENKRRVHLAPGGEELRGQLDSLTKGADVVLWSSQKGPRGPVWEALEPLRTPTDFVLTLITPFGIDGPYADYVASDSVLMALGGLLSLSGYPDQPVVPFGEQAFYAASLHAALGTVLAVRRLEAAGEGQEVEVSAQEAVAHALENAVQFVDLEGVVRTRIGTAEPEAGTGVFACRDGYVFLMSSLQGALLGWENLVAWVDGGDEGLAARLRCEHWADPRFRASAEAKAQFRSIFESFAADQDKRELYEGGQARSVNIAPLMTPRDICSDPHLAARRFFGSATSEHLKESVGLVGPPFRMPGVSGHRRDWGPTCDPSDVAVAWPPRRRARAAEPPERVLEGIRVVDFTWVGVGPFATKFLADHGADVIKIESRTRLDPIRMMRPAADGEPGVDRSGYFANRNTNKRSITLNLKQAEGRNLAARLIARSDVVVNNFRPGALLRAGLGYEDVRALRDDIIYVDMPMMGSGGPYAKFGGYGMMMNALGGLFALTGLPGRPPVGTGTNYPDHVPNPLHAALAVVAAIRRRDRAGEGSHIELAQVESTLALLGPHLMAYLADGKDLEPVGNRHPEALQGVFSCRDGDWCAVTVEEDCWAAMADAIGRPGWVDARPRPEEADEALAAWFAERDSRAAMELLQLRGIPAARVQDARDVLDDPQLRHRGHWISLDHPEMGECVYDAPVARLSKTPARLLRGAPMLGAHTGEVCAELLEVDEVTFREMEAAGAFA